MKLLLLLLLCTPNPKVVKSFDLPWHLVNNIRVFLGYYNRWYNTIGRGSKCVHKIWHNDAETGKSDSVKQINSMSKVLRDTKFIYTPARTFIRFTCKRSIGSTRCAPAGVPCCVLQCALQMVMHTCIFEHPAVEKWLSILSRTVISISEHIKKNTNTIQKNTNQKDPSIAVRSVCNSMYVAIVCHL